MKAAIIEARDAFDAWVMAEREDKGKLPAPAIYSGQFVQCLPNSLHRQLGQRAEREGVSLNQLATTLLAGSGVGPALMPSRPAFASLHGKDSLALHIQ